ncbi:Uncharacterized conserved protein [Acholeplasma oculi]|uniref:YdhG-like domain-containing protein n=1 Tax=Acholeplasma oculi TaxID=35623 RepID=A0A061AEW5_9MOLU|nr:hypothetical protein [Acholeplasma oculi]CDR30076.1 hypothetical protein, YdhG-like superfamily [Acholeplasma oculi]SUT88285.1 Uncharacterized conserved protein [Acholeplasma oculi]
MQTSQSETKLINRVSKYKEPFRSIGLKLHETIMKTRPELQPSSMYGMPAYRDPNTKKLVCFFRHDEYVTFGLLEDAVFEFDDQNQMIPTSWFIKVFNDTVKKNIVSILEKHIQK